MKDIFIFVKFYVRVLMRIENKEKERILMKCPNCDSVNVEDYTDEFKMVGYRCLRCGCIWFENEWGF